jgi:hypothetical protein
MDDRNRHKPFDPVAGLCLMAFLHLVSTCRAVQARNAAAVSELVDFPALRRSLTVQIVRTYPRLTGKAGRPGSIIEQFSVGVGVSVADSIVAKLISPEALLELRHNGQPPVFSG